MRIIKLKTLSLIIDGIAVEVVRPDDIELPFELDGMQSEIRPIDYLLLAVSNYRHQNEFPKVSVHTEIVFDEEGFEASHYTKMMIFDPLIHGQLIANAFTDTPTLDTSVFPCVKWELEMGKPSSKRHLTAYLTHVENPTMFTTFTWIVIVQ